MPLRSLSSWIGPSTRSDRFRPLWSPAGKRVLFATSRSPAGQPQINLPFLSGEQDPAGNVHLQQDIIYTCDPLGYFTYVNPMAARVMKYDAEELVGRHFLTLIHLDYRLRAEELYRRQIVERKANTYFEFPALAKDGTKVWVGQHVQLIDDGTRITGFQAIARDITRQKVDAARVDSRRNRPDVVFHGRCLMLIAAAA